MVEIAFLGLGGMGRRMAARLLSAGHAVRVWNRTEARTGELKKAGATVAASPRDAARGADFVISMVRDDHASSLVWTDPDSGALAAMSAGAIAIECSTLSIDWVRILARRAGETGIAFIDAPVAGSLPQAEQGTLVFFASGDEDTFKRALTVLRAMGSTLHQAGPKAGDGTLVKLIVNALLGIEIGATAEMIALARRHGADTARIFEMVATTAVSSPAMQFAARSMTEEQFAPMFPIELMEKDLVYAMEAAGGGEGFALSRATRMLFGSALAEGYGPDHITKVSLLHKEKSA